VSQDQVVNAWLNFTERFWDHPALFATETKSEPWGSTTLNEFLDHCAYVTQNVDRTVPGYQGLFVVSGVQLNGSAWGGSYEKSALESAPFADLPHPSSLCAVNTSPDGYVFVPHVLRTRCSGGRSTR
jgi:hypothetical protein